jgi:hypothetical protein
MDPVGTIVALVVFFGSMLVVAKMISDSTPDDWLDWPKNDKFHIKVSSHHARMEKNNCIDDLSDSTRRILDIRVPLPPRR